MVCCQLTFALVLFSTVPQKKVEKHPLFKDLGGMNEVLEELQMHVLMPFFNPSLSQILGVKPITGVLLHGPAGCGKTLLANAVGNESGLPFYKICEVTEENIIEQFSKARETASSIIFIDNVDVIAFKSDISDEMEQRIVNQLRSCMDESAKLAEPKNSSGSVENSACMSGFVLVLGATYRLDAIEPSFRRFGRFEHEIYIGAPDEYARLDILSVLARDLKVEDENGDKGIALSWVTSISVIVILMFSISISEEGCFQKSSRGSPSTGTLDFLWYVRFIASAPALPISPLKSAPTNPSVDLAIFPRSIANIL